MKKSFILGAALSAVLFFAACDDDSSSTSANNEPSEDVTLSSSDKALSSSSEKAVSSSSEKKASSDEKSSSSEKQAEPKSSSDKASGDVKSSSSETSTENAKSSSSEKAAEESSSSIEDAVSSSSEAESSDSEKSSSSVESSSSEDVTESSSSIDTPEQSSSSLDGFDWDHPKEYYIDLNSSYHYITDERDGKVYKIVKIEDQWWMAENLNYTDSAKTPSLKGKIWCYDNKPEYCDIGGAYYTWAAAIDSVALYDDGNGVDCGYGKTCALPDTVQGICPKGWHLPTKNEWNELLSGIVCCGDNTSGKKLKSKRGWISYQGTKEPNGTDKFQFTALPLGYYIDGIINWSGQYASFWGATTVSESADPEKKYAVTMILSADNVSAYTSSQAKRLGRNVRCVKDAE